MSVIVRSSIAIFSCCFLAACFDGAGKSVSRPVEQVYEMLTSSKLKKHLNQIAVHKIVRKDRRNHTIVIARHHQGREQYSYLVTVSEKSASSSKVTVQLYPDGLDGSLKGSVNLIYGIALESIVSFLEGRDYKKKNIAWKEAVYVPGTQEPTYGTMSELKENSKTMARQHGIAVPD
jgi:hypothetical protein